MKKVISILLALIMLLSLCACGGSTKNYSKSGSSTYSSSSSGETSTTSSKGTNSSNNVVFTNKYGTPTTKCAHSGCNNYIAPSGDTNCCTTHSNECLKCHKYIDEDALYCVDCLVVAADKVQSSTDKSSSSSKTTVFTNKYGTPTTKCAHSGCNNYIAPSGDTNCCTTHSNKCGNCGKYIDEDAILCIDCIAAALK